MMEHAPLIHDIVSGEGTHQVRDGSVGGSLWVHEGVLCV